MESWRSSIGKLACIKLLPGTSLKIVGFGHTDELCALHASWYSPCLFKWMNGRTRWWLINKCNLRHPRQHWEFFHIHFALTIIKEIKKYTILYFVVRQRPPLLMNFINFCAIFHNNFHEKLLDKEYKITWFEENTAKKNQIDVISCRCFSFYLQKVFGVFNLKKKHQLFFFLKEWYMCAWTKEKGTYFNRTD